VQQSSSSISKSDDPLLHTLWPDDNEAPGSARQRCLGERETVGDDTESGSDVGDTKNNLLARTREG
jgi:hypothetical protein